MTIRWPSTDSPLFHFRNGVVADRYTGEVWDG